MLKFSQFLLLEGGGKIKTEKGDVAVPINADEHPKGKEGAAADVHGFLSGLHDAVTGNSLYGRGKAALTQLTAFSGSTPELFKKDRPKKQFGDIDTMVAEHHLQKNSGLERALHPGARYGAYTVEGTKRYGTDLSALVRHPSGQLHQIDFQSVRYEGDHPAPFYQESRNSHPEDMDAGLKGLTHKALLISATKGSSAFQGREYYKGKSPEVKHEGLHPDFTYSSQKGIRRATQRLGVDKDGTIISRKISSTEKPQYDDDLTSVRKTIFGNPKAETQSFHGVVRSMNKHFNPTQVDHTLHFLKEEFSDDKYKPDQVSKAVGILKEQMPQHIDLIKKHFPEHF